ncbi:MAG: hypothetical protein ACE5FN_07105 [Leptospirillia bacterium]
MTRQTATRMTHRLCMALAVLALVACQKKTNEPAPAAHTAPVQAMQAAPVEPAFTDDEQAYAKAHLQVKDFRIGVGKQTDGEVRAAFGVVVNSGERALEMVEITVSYLDDNEGELGQARLQPVVPASHGTDAEAALLKPSTERGFGFSVESGAPEGWGTKARVTISDLTFHN